MIPVCDCSNKKCNTTLATLITVAFKGIVSKKDASANVRLTVRRQRAHPPAK